jgi:pyruvate/2-oxoglutarate dehydrogenase complex dihydrolipoamide acyltransferase (E2) component
VSSSPTESLPAPEAPTTIDVTMPQMGVSVAEGTVVAWRVEVGDRVEAEQTVCEISTDKIDTEVPAPVGGVVAEIIVGVEETVEVGVVLARIATGDAILPPTPPPEPRSENGRRRYSPVVQRIAAEHDIDLSVVVGTGRDGRVRKQDVLAVVGTTGAAPAEPPMHIESPYRPDPPPAPAVGTAPPGAAPALLVGAPGAAAALPAADGGGLSRMRRQIGQHMKRSLDTAATCTTWIEADMGRVEVARARLGVTALAFVARATIDALREYPALNAWLDGDRYTRVDDVNLGFAVSLGEDGLIVPVIHRAHELSVEGLAARIRDLAGRARDRSLSPDDVAGGTFTITNPGQYGSIMATPIINQPQVGILDLEAIVKRPVVLTDAQGTDSIAIRPMTILGLSWDHRALDGVLSAQFLAGVKRRLEGVVV